MVYQVIAQSISNGIIIIQQMINMISLCDKCSLFITISCAKNIKGMPALWYLNQGIGMIAQYYCYRY